MTNIDVDWPGKLLDNSFYIDTEAAVVVDAVDEHMSLSLECMIPIIRLTDAYCK
jgi:hypothetical protein